MPLADRSLQKQKKEPAPVLDRESDVPPASSRSAA
jgi:hypothetical protein